MSGADEESHVELLEAPAPEKVAGSREVDPPVADDSSQPAIPLMDILEAILFSSQKPVSSKELLAILRGASDDREPATRAFKKIKEAALIAALDELAARCVREGRTYEVRESAAGWQLVTRATYAPWLRQLFPENRPARLSAPAMETLAIIAYRQPITRADIEAVRGVAVDGVMQTLLDRGLVKIAGRADIPGRPLLYETTQFFMEHFGIRSLDELPNAGELRKVDLPTAKPPTEASAAGVPSPQAEGQAESNEAGNPARR